MAGHNKWSKVKHIKGVVDVRRGRIFSKLSKELSVAARQGGGDPALNSRLRQAINAARAQNMPGDTIERAILKGTGELEGQSIEEIFYEGYGPGGIALLVQTATDNKNRTAADIRQAFTRNSGNLGSTGSVTFLFQRKAEITVPLAAGSEDRILELALEAGAEDVSQDGDHHCILTGPDALAAVADYLQSQDVEVISQKLIYLPETSILIEDPEVAAEIIRLCEALDDLDDTIQVFSNFELPDSVLTELRT